MKKIVSDDLLIKFSLGEASPEETLQVDNWLAADSAHPKQLEQIKVILETSKRLAPVSPLSEAQAWERFKSKRDQTQIKKGHTVPLKFRSVWLRVAAAVFMIAGVAWVASYYYRDDRKQLQSWVIVKASNKVLVDTLPDGSIVHINKNSVLSYFSDFKSSRKIKLSGEAFFNVVHIESQPFTVEAGDLVVHDVGTAFNIKSRNYRTDVIVESGIVQINRKQDVVQLNANQMVSVRPDDKKIKIEGNSNELYNYYVGTTFAADNTPLWQLTRVLKEAYGAEIRIDNAAYRNSRVTVQINLHDSLDDVLELIRLTTPGMQILKTGTTYVIR